MCIRDSLWGNLINMCATFRAWRQKIAYVLLRGREALSLIHIFNQVKGSCWNTDIAEDRTTR